jgi:hypothetical protein
MQHQGSRSTSFPPLMRAGGSKYIKELPEQGLPPTQAMIRRFGSDIAKRRLGKNCVDRYIKRHKVDLISRWATGINRLRHQANSQSKYSLYFTLLHSKISQYDIEPRHTYNMDEKGFMLGVVTRSKRVFSKRLYVRMGRSRLTSRVAIESG